MASRQEIFSKEKAIRAARQVPSLMWSSKSLDLSQQFGRNGVYSEKAIRRIACTWWGLPIRN